MDRKRGQITIFLILGVVLVFIVVAVILLSVTIQKTTLEKKHQEIAQRLLQKEALRIYVDEELPDIIDEFLINFGKQGGRVYEDQGGLEPFVEEDILDDAGNVVLRKNGLRYSLGAEELKVAYGIRYEPNDNYPCQAGNSLPCRYQYPQRRAGGNIVRFGTPELPRISVVEQQLARYLRDRLVGFIQDFIEQKIHLDAQVISSDEPPEIDVYFESERLRVTVKYPLILRYQGEDIAALADFSFFYETTFKQYYDAVRELFQLDNEFLDFEFTGDQLAGDTFDYDVQYEGDPAPTYCQPIENGPHHCTRNLKFALVKNTVEFTRVDNVDNSAGDDIFIFRVPPGTILRDQEYFFVIARQNRPSVLDYINRIPGATFDYLVVLNNPELSSITITPFTVNPPQQADVRDPDEEELRDFEIWKITEGDNQELLYKLHQGIDPFNYEPEEKTQLKVTATDGNGISDTQRIGICTDPVIFANLYHRLSRESGESHPRISSLLNDAPREQLYCGCHEVMEQILSDRGLVFHCSKNDGQFDGICNDTGGCDEAPPPPNQ